MTKSVIYQTSCMPYPYSSGGPKSWLPSLQADDFKCLRTINYPVRMGGLRELGHRDSWATPRYHSNAKLYDQVLPSNERTIHHILFDVTSLSNTYSMTSLCQQIDYIEKNVKNRSKLSNLLAYQ